VLELICLAVGSFFEASVGAYDRTKGSRWLSKSSERTSWELAL